MLFNIVYATELTANDSAAKDQIGIVRAEYDTTNGWRYFKYVQANADTTVANGTTLTYTNNLRTNVTSDISDTSQNRPAGVGIGAITASYYGWIQIKGYHSAVKTDAGDDIAAGDYLIVAASTNDGMCDRVAAGTASTYQPLGVAAAADVDAADTVAAFLCCDF